MCKTQNLTWMLKNVYLLRNRRFPSSKCSNEHMEKNFFLTFLWISQHWYRKHVDNSWILTFSIQILYLWIFLKLIFRTFPEICYNVFGDYKKRVEIWILYLCAQIFKKKKFCVRSKNSTNFFTNFRYTYIVFIYKNVNFVN